MSWSVGKLDPMSTCPISVFSEPDPSTDPHDKGSGRQGEGADPPGSPGDAGPVPGTGEKPHTCTDQWHQNLHHSQGLR